MVAVGGLLDSKAVFRLFFLKVVETARQPQESHPEAATPLLRSAGGWHRPGSRHATALDGISL